MGKESTTIILAGSHLPVLVTLLQATSGAVLELGCGYNSTPVLFWLCKSKNRILESYENDREWIEKVGYPVFYTENFEIQSPVTFWDIVFIDHRPARKRRSSALYYRNKARFVVLHDSELANNPAYKYTPIYKEFKYKYEYTKTLPHTIILSNFEDPSKYFLT